MQTKEKFPYELEQGAVMDFADGKFMLVIKDEDWTDEEIGLLRHGIDVHFCYTNGIAIFVLEGGDIDSSDFYFNIQECDEKDALLSQDAIDLEVFLLNAANEICWKKVLHLTADQRQTIQLYLQQQAQTEFMPGEYDVNVEGMQSAYEPFELLKFAKLEVKG